MTCPFCTHNKTEIYNTRSTKNNTVTWRRRRCLACKNAFTTEEVFNPSGVWRVKSSNGTKAYSRIILLLSLVRACDHRNNQEVAAQYILETIEQSLRKIASKRPKKTTITTGNIATLASKALKSYDKAAYIKYVSYHLPHIAARELRS